MSFLRISLLIFLGFIAFAKASEIETTEHTPVSNTEDAATAAKPKPKTTEDGTAETREKLRHQLFDKYDIKTKPDNMTVKFGVAMIRFDVDEDHSNLNSLVWLRYVWNDPRLSFNSEDFGGVSVLRVDSADVWKPDITLYNSALADMVKCWGSNVLVYPNGEVLWVPPCELVSMCNLTTERNPYGEQHCTLKFGSWTYDGNSMDLQLYNDKTEIDISDMWESNEWELVSNSAKRTVKHYDCCAEGYPDLTFSMTIKRRADVPCSAH